VLKRVALAHGLAVAEHTPLVRPTRAERQELAEGAAYGVGQPECGHVEARAHGRTGAVAAGRPDEPAVDIAQSVDSTGSQECSISWALVGRGDGTASWLNPVARPEDGR
jgi:hypothetical protein